MPERELGEQLKRLDGENLNRRDFLKKLAGFSAVALSGPGFVIRNNQVRDRWKDRVGKFKNQYPQLPEDVKKGAAQFNTHERLTQTREYILDTDATTGVEGVSAREAIDDAFGVTDKNHLDKITNDNLQAQEWLKRRDKEANDKAGDEPSAWPILAGIGTTIGGIGGIVATGIQEGNQLDLETRQTQEHNRRLRLRDAVLMANPEWSSNPPTDKDLKRFIKICKYLPPLGGKIGSPGNPRPTSKSPQYLAEIHAKEIISGKNKGEYGNVFIHQLAVQGRLPDRFKYAALALILNNPYGADWEEPLSEAYWGKVAPLVHDGGTVDKKLNRSWRHVKGRTDFLQRIVVKHKEPTPESTGHLANTFEDQRLVAEARFYQRAALALHAHVGSAPSEIPRKIRHELAQEWETFENRIKLLLSEYDISDVSDVTWFRKVPRFVDGWHPVLRREGDYEPVKEKLVHLEEVREANLTELRERSAQIMAQTADAVDHIIGLDTFLGDSSSLAA